MFIQQVRLVFIRAGLSRGRLGRRAGVHRVSLAADRDCRHNGHAQPHEETAVEVETGELPPAAKTGLLAQHLRRAGRHALIRVFFQSLVLVLCFLTCPR
jgi:hypothetical protein